MVRPRDSGAQAYDRATDSCWLPDLLDGRGARVYGDGIEAGPCLGGYRLPILTDKGCGSCNMEFRS